MERRDVGLDGRTLMLAIKSMHETITRLETALRSAAVQEREPILRLLVSYDEAADGLKAAYQRARLESRRELPPYEGLLPD